MSSLIGRLLALVLIASSSLPEATLAQGSSAAASPAHAASPQSTSPAHTASPSASRPPPVVGASASVPGRAPGNGQVNATASQSNPVAVSGSTRTVEAADRLWVTIVSENRRTNRIVRVQMPLEWVPSLELLLSADLQADLKRQKVDLKLMSVLARATGVGERVEVSRARNGDSEVRIAFERRSVPVAGTWASSIQLQVREGREEGLRSDATLPLELSRMAAPLVAGVELQGERPGDDVERLVSVEKLVASLGRAEPFELLVVEGAGGNRLVLRTR